MEIKVYGYDRNPRTRVVRIVAELAGIHVQQIEVVPRLNVNKAEYLAKFPLSAGKIPAIEAENVQLTETIAIIVFIARQSKNDSKLLGDGSVEQEAQVLSYLSWANQELLTILPSWYLPLIPGFTDPPPFDEKAVLEGKAKSEKLLTSLESLLGVKTWLVGSHLTLADVMVAVYISRGLEWVLGESWRQTHPNIMRHFKAVTDDQAVKRVIPNFILIEKETPLEDPYQGKR